MAPTQTHMTPANQTQEFDELLSIRAVAMKAQWSYKRMLAHLTRRNEELHGLLLINVARAGARPHYKIANSALMRLHPQWAKEQESMPARIAVLEAGYQRLSRLVDQQHRHIMRLVDERRSA